MGQEPKHSGSLVDEDAASQPRGDLVERRRAYSLHPPVLPNEQVQHWYYAIVTETDGPPAKPDGDATRSEFYNTRCDVFGPVEFSRLLELQRNGFLTNRDLVWNAAFPDWRPVSVVPRLNPTWYAATVSRNVPAPIKSNLLPSDRLPMFVLLLLVSLYIVPMVSSSTTFSARGIESTEDELLPTSDAYDVEVCNYGASEKVFISFGYHDPWARDWISRGWYPVAKNDCRVILKNVSGQVYGLSESDEGTVPALEFPGESRSFCVDHKDGFVMKQKDCQGAQDAAGEVGQNVMRTFQLLPVSPSHKVFRWEIKE